MSQPEYTFEQVAASFVRKAANYTGYRFRHYGVTAADAAQEIYVWLYGDGKAPVERYLESRPQQTTRIYRSMLDVALSYAETEKAAKVGYRPDDVHWYTTNAVEGLMPLVLDPTYTQENGHVGDLVTMVVDIRRVLDGDAYDYFLLADSSDANWDDALRQVVDKLGGARPYVGRRKVMRNAQAQAITTEAC